MFLLDNLVKRFSESFKLIKNDSQWVLDEIQRDMR